MLGDHLTILIFTFGVDSIFEEVAGFSPFMVSTIKNIVFISLVFVCYTIYSLSKDPNIMLA